MCRTTLRGPPYSDSSRTASDTFSARLTVGKVVEILAECRQILRARIDPVALVGTETIDQALRPGRFVAGVQPGTVDTAS